MSAPEEIVLQPTVVKLTLAPQPVTLVQQAVGLSLTSPRTPVLLTPAETTVRIVAAGTQGPEGIPGPPGPQGATGPQGPAGPGDKSFAFEQAGASASWTVAHGLGKFPAVTVVDSAGSRVAGDVTYLDADHVRLDFTVPFSGTAYLN